MARTESGIMTWNVPQCGVAAFAASDFEAGEFILQEEATLLSTVPICPKNREMWQALLRLERTGLPVFEPAGHLGALCALRDMGVRACRETLLTKCYGPEEELPSKIESNRQMKVLRAAIGERLVPASCSAFSADEYSRLRQVIQLNGFRVNGDVVEGERGYDVGEAMFDNVSRINHSCEPNATFNIIIKEPDSTVQITIIALKKLSKGEEVNISYLSERLRGELTPTQRQQTLKKHWLFECRCPRCLAELGKTCENTTPPNKVVPQLLARSRTQSTDSYFSSDQGMCWDDLCDPDDDCLTGCPETP